MSFSSGPGTFFANNSTEPPIMSPVNCVIQNASGPYRFINNNASLVYALFLCKSEQRATIFVYCVCFCGGKKMLTCPTSRWGARGPFVEWRKRGRCSRNKISWRKRNLSVRCVLVLSFYFHVEFHSFSIRYVRGSYTLSLFRVCTRKKVITARFDDFTMWKEGAGASFWEGSWRQVTPLCLSMAVFSVNTSRAYGISMSNVCSGPTHF